ncbi:predicted protein [Postia placenta Mad-698-R]|uniref:DUF6534 domain-containing protein n=1 Tax=Postia placenta MAD-698-R-SB12 TaxID=670580 RepID=A0A1X6N3R8_9APHY|nr:hypothetical protein POSPLADRAFT_1046421 [Postia placenta MAD-698-R-SB12]EED83324.1 predicted protein [Postia placenta Mad-698-R]OSX63116.1 hypothetical protein POSPLADRAFT_1046421 [Postia placenta MAD-698-R-SB12]
MGWLGGGALVDIIIAVAMYILVQRNVRLTYAFQLHKSRRGERERHILLNRLIKHIVGSGIVTAGVALLVLVLYIYSFYAHAALADCPYANTVLISLNNRDLGPTQDSVSFQEPPLKTVGEQFLCCARQWGVAELDGRAVDREGERKTSKFVQKVLEVMFFIKPCSCQPVSCLPANTCGGVDRCMEATYLESPGRSSLTGTSPVNMGNTNSIAEQDAEDDLRELLIATGLREPTGRPSRDPQPSDQAAVPWASMPPYGYAPVTQSAMLPYQMPSAYPSYFTPPSILPPPSYPAIGWNAPPPMPEQVDDPAETDEDGFDSVPGSLLSFRTWPPVSSGARRRLRPTYRMMRALERGVYPGNALGISLEDGTSMLSQYASDTSELYAEDIRYGNMNPRPEVGSQSSAETIRVIPSTPQLSSSSTQFSPVIPPRPPPSSSATAYTSLSMPSSPQGSEAESMASPAASSTMTDQESPSPAGPLHASLTAMTGFVIGKRFRKMFRTQPSAKPTSENEALPHRSTSSSKMDRQIGICRGRKSDILALDSSWDDARLFVELGKSYDKLRAWRKWLSLRGLKSITLVVDADIEKIIYPYRVGPTKVTAHRNMRLRWYLEHPEKLKDKDEFVRIVTQHPGLGIEFVERWQPSRITIVIATLVTLSLVVALAYSEVTGDIVTGFTVAAYALYLSA